MPDIHTLSPSDLAGISLQSPLTGVTRNENEPPEPAWLTPPLSLSTDQLQDARWLPLNATAASPNAVALVTELVARVIAMEASSGRRTKRRKAGQVKLSGAVAAIIGGALRRWSRRIPEAVFRSRTPADFTGGPVASRQFLAAMDGLVKLGLVHRSMAIRYLAFSFGDGVDIYMGKAPRHWPTAALLAMANQHGMTPRTVGADFAEIIPTIPPEVPKPLRVSALKRPGRKDRQPLPLSKLGDAMDRLRQSVEEANAFAASHDVRGCLPPRWYRVFTECALLGGRWQAAGKEGLYQLMPEAERLAQITINGEAVAEVDVKASQLSIMHGLLGLPLPDGDPYEFPDVPRSVVKSWIVAAIGKGSPVTRWARKAMKDNPELLSHDPKHVGGAICHRYPFMRKPADAVCVQAGLDKLTHIAKPAKLLTHRLMAIEAEVIGGAMRYLRTDGVLALPIHDSLIVPRSGVGHAKDGLIGAFATLAKVRVRLTVD
jgi:hypothetical protein